MIKFSILLKTLIEILLFIVRFLFSVFQTHIMNVNQERLYKRILVLSVVLVMAIAIPSTTVLAATGGYLTIDTAKVSTGALAALLQTDGIIPQDGSGGAFGYGIMTNAGNNAVIVATTNAGLKDSVTQGSDSDPVWHNQFVRLAAGSSCNGNPQVAAITFEQPGIVSVTGSQVSIAGIPSSFTGTDALTGNPLTLTPGHDVQRVVSFVLVPKSQGVICVENMKDAANIIKSKGGEGSGGSDSGGIGSGGIGSGGIGSGGIGSGGIGSGDLS
jgi:uncharacterized membrane protein YgcG